MKHALDTPTITAHALGELSATETRLLRMTFHDSISSEMLETECNELRQTAHSLSHILKKEAARTTDLGLTDEQRKHLLAITAEPYPAGTSAPVSTQPRAPLSMEKIQAERRAFDNSPSRFATYLTIGAAAAVVLLLTVLRTNPTPGSSADRSGNGGVASGAVGSSSIPETMATTHFKIIPAAEPDSENAAVAGSAANPTALPELRVPQGPAIPKPDIAQFKNDIPAPTAPEKATAKISEPVEAPKATAPIKEKKKPQIFATPK